MSKKIFLFFFFLFFVCFTRPVLAIEPDELDFGIWHFDEMSGVTAYDASPNQNNLGWGSNFYGGGRPYPTRVPGKWDMGIDFSQNEEHYYLERTEPIDFSGGLSLGLWIKTDYSSSDKIKILWLGNYLDSRVQDPSNFILLSLESGRVVLDLKQDKEWQGEISSSGLANDNSWHFVSAVFDVPEQRFYLYLDGQIQGSASFDNPLPTLQRMSIGRREYYYDPREYNFSGTIDDLWIRKEAVSNEKILEIYNSNSPYKQEISNPGLAPITVFANHDFDHLNGTVALDNSPNHYDLIWGYNPYSTGEPNPRIVPGKFGDGVNFKKVWDTYAMRLDNAKNFDDGMSLGIWVKTATISTDPSRILWFGNEMPNRIGDQARGDYFRLTEKDGKLTATLSYFDLYHQDSQKVFYRQYNASSEKIISDNEWHQVIVSLDPRPGVHTIKLYIDVELQSETFFPNAIPYLTRLYLAHRELSSTGTEYNYAGDLDDLFVLNSVLKPEEVQNIYQSNQSFIWPIQKKRNPVIIVPGIMGSWKKHGEWTLDPIMHTYDNLINAMVDNGYEVGNNLFILPYDWRQDNVKTALELKELIKWVKENKGVKKVDLVAHSMGGLVSRYYVQSASYQNDVDKLIFLDTPHLGSPKSYLMFEGGIITGSFRRLQQKIFQLEAIENGYLSLVKYIKEQVNSVEQLLPVYNYLQEKNNGDWIDRIYPVQYPRNIFLEELNEPEKLHILRNRVNITNITSLTRKSGTLRKIKVIGDPDIYDNTWFDGYPNDIDNGDLSCFVEDIGDGTVPDNSLRFLTGVDSIEIGESEHQDIPTKAQKDVIKVLTGIEPGNYREGLWENVKNILLVRVYSPVDFVIVAPDGKKLGKDFDNNSESNKVDGAFYSGFDTDEEFAVIPNPLDGEYKIELQGTGSGEYTLSTSIIEDNTDIDKNFSGIISPSETRVFQIDYIAQSDDILGELEPVDTGPPVITINNPKENEQYLHSDNLEIDYGITDDFSGVASSSLTIDNIEITTSNVNLFDYSLGEHSLKITAQDKTGNQSQLQVKFSVITDIDSTIKDVNEVYQRSWLRKLSEKVILEIFLNILKTGLTIYDKESEIVNQLIIKTQENSWMSETVKTKLINQYQRRLVDLREKRTKFINQRIDLIKNKLDILKKNNQINSFGYDIILSDINYLKNNL